MAGVSEPQEAILRALASTLPDIIFVYDLKAQSVRFVNGASSRPLGFSPEDIEAMGDQVMARLAHPDDLPRIAAYLAQVSGLEEGKSASLDSRALHQDGRYRPYTSRATVFSRDAEGAAELIIGVAQDISEQTRIEEEVHDLSERLLEVQVKERRNLAQDLHDTTAQHLIGVDLAVGRIHKICSEDECCPSTIMAAIADARQSLEQAKRDIRVQTFLLHPPFIESHGLGHAVANFASGFGARAGLEVELSIDPAADRIGGDLAVSLFRTAQEALANVYRHAHARKIAIALAVDETEVTLSVADDGVGLDESTWDSGITWGVGLSGIRERMQAQDGSVALERADPGTRLVVKVPRPPPLPAWRPG